MITAKSPSYRALSGAYLHSDASSLQSSPPVGKLFALYPLKALLSIEAETARHSAITEELAHARLAGLDGFCFLVSAEPSEPEMVVLREFLSHPRMLRHFALRHESTLAPLSETWHGPLATTISDPRHLPDLTQAPLLPSHTNALSVQPDISAAAYRDILSEEAKHARSGGAIGYITAPPRTLSAGDESATLYGATLRFIRRATALAAPAGDCAIVVIDRWNATASSSKASTTASSTWLRVIEHTARSRWAAPALPLHSVDDEYQHYLCLAHRLTSEERSDQPLDNARYRGRKPWLHSLLNTLRSYEFLHRPYRWVRNVIQEMRG